MSIEADWPEVHVPVPGSRPRVEHVKKELKRTDDAPWDRYPKVLLVNGVTMELFDATAMAKALGRTLSTLYSWEEKGWFPATDIRAPRRSQLTFTTSKGRTARMRGRRLYPRKFVEGCIQIINDLGLQHPGVEIQGTEFSERVFDLWEECYPGGMS